MSAAPTPTTRPGRLAGKVALITGTAATSRWAASVARVLLGRVGLPTFRAMSTDSGSGPERGAAGSGLRAAAGRTLSLLASLVRVVTVVFAAVLVVHVVLVVASANPRNGVAMALASAADHLTLGLGDLFASSSPLLEVVLNYGLPAVVWLIIGIIVSRLLGALAR